jgi:hypothetical protein
MSCGAFQVGPGVPYSFQPWEDNGTPTVSSDHRQPKIVTALNATIFFFLIKNELTALDAAA